MSIPLHPVLGVCLTSCRWVPWGDAARIGNIRHPVLIQFLHGSDRGASVKEIYFARQPIYNRNLQVEGYELF